jgi:hypothetical protein
MEDPMPVCVSVSWARIHGSAMARPAPRQRGFDVTVSNHPRTLPDRWPRPAHGSDTSGRCG